MRSEKKRVIIFVSALIVLALFLSFYFDNKIVRDVSFIRTPILTSFFTLINNTFFIIAAFIFLTILLVKENENRWIIPVWISLAITELVGFVLKEVVQRHRPFQLGLVSVVAGVVENGFSFPSLHTALLFSAIPFLSKGFPRFKYVWIVFACLIAFSRIYLGVHFLSDVIVGSVLGYLIGYSVMKWRER